MNDKSCFNSMSQTHHELKQQLIQQTNGLHTTSLSLLGEVLGLDTKRG